MVKKISILATLAALSLLLFLFYDVNYDIFEYVFSKRLEKLYAIIITSISIGTATLVFQAITNNRILTPSVLGLDSLYILFQLSVVLIFGVYSVFVANPYLNFALSAVLMSLFSLVLYRIIFTRQKSIFMVILIGVVMGTFFSSLNGMIQIMLSPDTYTMILDRLFASFTDVNGDLVGLSSLLIILIIFFVFRKKHVLDVISLGKDHAINLGLNYDQEVQRLLVTVFLLVSIATALVGPITFLGFFAVNIAKNYLKHYKHSYLIIGTLLISIITLCLGQFMVEHVFGFGLPVSVLISLIGGTYFIFMLLKESQS